jgi:DNA-binding PadR family transcriptional regulator
MEYPDPQINEREAAVLGLLYEKPLYGYTIEKIIEDRGMRHWTDIGFSSLYYVLKRLEGRSLIASSCLQQEDKPSRKVYTITEDGRRIMKAKVRSLLSQHQRIASPFDLGVSHLHLLPAEETIACLQERVRALDQAIERVTSHRGHHEKVKKPFFILALSDRVLAHLNTERNWVETFIGEVKQHAQPDPDQ